MGRWTKMRMKLVSMRNFKGLTRTVCRIYLTEKGAIGIDRHGGEVTTTVDQLNLSFRKSGSRIGCLNHGNWGLDDLLLTLHHDLLLTTSTSRLGFAFLLEVHHTPNDKDEYQGVYEKTHSRGTSRRGGDPGSQNSPDETESLGVRNDEESHTRNEGNDELILLLFTVTATATIFK